MAQTTLFEGIGTALITPFDEGGKIDYPALGRLVDLQIASGVSALVLGGTTGEGATLSHREKCRIVSFAKERVAGRVPIFGNCGSNDTKEAASLARDLAKSGADGLLAVTPYYNKATREGLCLHYRAIAAKSDLPIMLYHVPSRTGLRLSLDDYRALAEIPQIRAVKEASGDLRLLSALTTEFANRFAVYTGNDNECLSAAALGAAGCVSVLSNLCPHACAALWNAARQGDLQTARQLDAELAKKGEALFYEVNPVPVKYVAARKGLCRLSYRLPLCPPSQQVARELDRLFL